MQFFTSKTILYARVVLLIALAYFLAVDPSMILESHFILLLGQAMELPMLLPTTKNESDSVLYGFISVLFGIQAISDLIPILADNVQHFETLVPTRLAIFFCLAAYSYMSTDLLLGNNVVFVYSFFEIWLNFLAYNNLRDERYYKVKHFVEEHGDQVQADEDRVRVDS